ncbi:hypothetical protein KIN20_015782 [Parelaphostrongylus tenuis]|uniref:Uncharacterized protein n=1 Tax=Parelaphostrongylus tenuis TaxID=148309 RepID=A0AAD5MKA0_PARTN|nr:hypothetical protein KIN20_015782 [Parelaphostrongylus tenuis]
MSAGREEVGQQRPLNVQSTSGVKGKVYAARKTNTEEMPATREAGKDQEDPTDRDEPSIEFIDIPSSKSTSPKPSKMNPPSKTPSQAKVWAVAGDN